ncbi:hypothetical protein R1sor_013013 [Riccia sorocarpa]|uniref:Glucosamine 6-phosphate N-acetyltransferase n=1 Tax=Riccia sorocarpa TaxID=122646 RepID=A0ABD3HBB8_9MARC
MIQPSLILQTSNGTLSWLEQRSLSNPNLSENVARLAAGHVEDVVVDQTARGQHLGQRIVSHLTNLSKQLGCSKLILDCSEAMPHSMSSVVLSVKGTKWAGTSGK